MIKSKNKEVIISLKKQIKRIKSATYSKVIDISKTTRINEICRTTFSSSENEKIANIKKRMQQRMASRKGSVVIERNWLIDDSELSYIEIPSRTQLLKQTQIIPNKYQR